MILKLKSLEIAGFRSFQERTLFEFPSSGLIFIHGKHTKRNDISSGTGKSSIAMAIAYALGYAPLPATELKNRWSDKIYVHLVITDGTNDYHIKRTPKLEVDMSQKHYVGQQAEEALRDLLRIPVDLIAPLTYRPQRQHGLFVHATDAANKEFLSILLNITQIEEAAEQLWQQYTQLESQQKHLEQLIESERTLINNLRVDESELSTALAQYENAKQRLSDCQSNNQLDGLNKEISLLKAEINKIQALSQMVVKAQNQNNHIKEQILSIQKNIQVIQSNRCPVCKREWLEHADTVNQLNQQINDLIQQMQNNLSVIKNAQIAMEQLPILEQQYQEKVTQVGQLSAPLHDAQNAYQAAKSYYNKLQQQIESVKKTSQKISNLAEQLQGITTQLDVVRHAMNILGRDGFLGVIFNEVLKNIEVRANAMIANVPNIDTFSISISNSKKTKTGNIKQVITCTLLQYGQPVNLRAVSGGQLSAIELCTDLAVRDVVQQRANIILDWIFLDEALDGLDFETKRIILSAIKEQVRGQVFIIDHDAALKECFDTVIQLSYDGKCSHYCK